MPHRMHRMVFVCAALMLAASTARADLLPAPNRGPSAGRAGGLDFKVEWMEFEMGPVGGPYYRKRRQIVVLSGCADGHPNCTLARSRNLLGMEVRAVDGTDLQPQKGMVQQILDAFASKSGARRVTLELVARAPKSEPIEVAFARR